MDKYLQGSNNQRTTSTPTKLSCKSYSKPMSLEGYWKHIHDMEELDESEELNGRRASSSNGEMSNEVFKPAQKYGTIDDMINMDSVNESCIPDVLRNMSKRSYQKIAQSMETPSYSRRPPYGMNEDDLHSNADTLSETHSMNLPPENLDRVYKIVFVGDSGVGKSSFIYRFCFDDFRPNFSETIGVDFQVKTIQVNREWTALQLWDTAGQERFRSITKQYFRRADGVVVMFDLTSESTFLNIKQWMISIEEEAEPDCMVMMIGSKLDLTGADSKLRKVKTETAKKLAKDYDASYIEVSALSGASVTEAMEKLAKKMSTNGDNLLKHSVLNLDISRDCEKKKKKGCC